MENEIRFNIFIYDNYFIDYLIDFNMEKLNINENDLNNNEPNKTFDKLRDLQQLIKKESALKELCI